MQEARLGLTSATGPKSGHADECPLVSWGALCPDSVGLQSRELYEG
jgi:hypothetical protein